MLDRVLLCAWYLNHKRHILLVAQWCFEVLGTGSCPFSKAGTTCLEGNPEEVIPRMFHGYLVTDLWSRTLFGEIHK